MLKAPPITVMQFAGHVRDCRHACMDAISKVAAWDAMLQPQPCSSTDSQPHCRLTSHMQ